MHKLIPFHKTRRGHPRRGRTSPCASGPRMGWGDGRSAAPFMQGSSIDRNKFITEFPRHDFKRLGFPVALRIAMSVSALSFAPLP